MRLSRTNSSHPFDTNGEQPAEREVSETVVLRSSAAGYSLPSSREPVPAVIPRPIYGTRPEGSEQRDNADELAALEIEGRGEAPVWQSAFVLKPNVRFTRTPESAFARKQPPVIEPVVSDVPAIAAAAETSSTIAAPVVEPSSVLVATHAPDSVVENPLPYEQERGALALALRLRREFAATVSTVSTETTGTAQQTAAPDLDIACFAREAIASVEVTPRAPLAGFAFPVSHHVFWEAMLCEPDLCDLQPVSRWTPPEVLMSSTSVTALYREIGVAQPGRSSIIIAPPMSVPAPSPIASVAVAPVERTVAAQPIIVPPPVAPVLVEVTPVAVVPEPHVATPEAAVSVTRIRPKFSLPSPIEISPSFRDGQLAAMGDAYEFPPVELLQVPQTQETAVITQEALEQSAGLLESVLEDFGIRGEIIDVRPGPVVTMYEFEPAPGVKSSRVIGLSDDIARSMSALSARVAVVPGRNVIGIELPNPVREMVYFRELIESQLYQESRFKLPLCLGKTIGGEPVIAELAKMPHLLVAGTTGSGKSVAINTMILSLLYRLKPEECRLIMVDPKMLELSVYDGIPHLLTPVVTDPKKAVMALKWAVREMEDRYRKMSRLGVRNIDGFNTRAATARAKGETILCSVQTGFDRSSGEPVYEQEEMDLQPMPYIVVIVDEMADLMMVAGKEIEGAIQRLAQMARAAGIHLIMATQRPSVDVITGTIKANFPTRISFQVTSKIDSRTILGEQGAEHLLGQGDMLHMVGGGRIARVHGPFVSDEEVEKVVAHLKTQGRPEYLGTVTEDADEVDETPEEDAAVFDKGAIAEEDGNDLYDKAVKVVLRDKKCSTSYIQRRLSIGYNRAASLVERMEKEGLVGAANHVGKRSIISGISGGREPIELPRDDLEE